MTQMRSLTKTEIMKIYSGPAERHFPAAELKPSVIIERLYDQNCYEGLGLYEQDKLVAYALFIKIPGQTTMLLDYYAVMEEKRKGGVGSTFLGEMKSFYKDRDGILLETEDPCGAADEEEKHIRIRRNAFYQRNGAYFTDTLSYLFDVQYRVLYLPLGREKDSAAVHEELANIYKVMLGDSFQKNVSMRRAKNYFLLDPGCCFYEIVNLAYFLNVTGQPVCYATVGGTPVTCMEGFTVQADEDFTAVQEGDIGSLIIPGGMHEDIPMDAVTPVLHKLRERGCLIGAICGGVTLLREAGILEGLEDIDSLDTEIAYSGNVVTARPNAYVDFAIEMGRKLHVFQDEADLQETIDSWKYFKRSPEA